MIFKKPVATIALNLVPRKGSWGGANQWTSQACRFLKFSNYRSVHQLKPGVDCILMTHTGLASGTTFLHHEVEVFKKRFPSVPCIHRINDNDIRKGTDRMNSLLAKANKVADHTVFVSAWLRDYHSAHWFDVGRPHSVIEPGADPSVFHPLGNRPPRAGEPFRVVTHHWSDNWSKGFDVYQEIDEAISSGNLPGFELWIVGRWPHEISWKTAKTFAPASGKPLADILRQCHLYVSASRHEPGAMHPVEGLQCGLPLIYHKDSGGTVAHGLRYGVVIHGNVCDALLAARENYLDLRQKLLTSPPSGDLMCLEYRRLIQKLIVESGG